MNREVKFRVWDKKKKEWYGASSEHTLTFYGFALFGECTMMCMPSVSYLEHLEITEFTGLTDKNGKEIYEGDIMSEKVHAETSNWASPMVHKPERSFVIEFERGSFVRDDTKEPMHSWLINCVSHRVEHEVIGNFYEHPELLELPTNPNA